MWWPMPIIPALRRLRQEDHKFKANLGYIWLPGQPGIYSEILSQQKTTTIKKNHSHVFLTTGSILRYLLLSNFIIEWTSQSTNTDLEGWTSQRTNTGLDGNYQSFNMASWYNHGMVNLRCMRLLPSYHGILLCSKLILISRRNILQNNKKSSIVTT
jgi:hypothetical protein